MHAHTHIKHTHTHAHTAHLFAEDCSDYSKGLPITKRKESCQHYSPVLEGSSYVNSLRVVHADLGIALL